MEHQGIIIIVLIVLVIWYTDNCIYEYFTDGHHVYSSLDKRKYKVVGGFGNEKSAANKMSEINTFIVSFLRYLRNKFLIKKIGTQKEQAFVSRVLQRYNPDVLTENWPKPGEDTSYVVNKGEKFGLCLRDKKYNKFHNENIIKFVTIHELTHIGTTTYGHNYEFWSWMKFMLVQAMHAGLYTPVDYQKAPTKYCGMDVFSNPYFSKYDWNKT